MRQFVSQDVWELPLSPTVKELGSHSDWMEEMFKLYLRRV